MSERHFIDCLEFAEQSLEIHDKIRAFQLPGLTDVLSSGAGEIEFRLIGGRFGRDKKSLELEVQGTLAVLCQRCLEEMEFPVSIARTFVLVADESAVPEDEFEDDAVDYLVAESKLDVEHLVQEEILLGLPLALRHESGCADAVKSPSAGKPNPFQVLAGLKKQ